MLGMNQMSKKHIAIVLIVIVIIPIVCLVITTISLINRSDISTEVRYESAIMSNGLVLIGIIVTVWTGLNIVQILEKRQVSTLEEEIKQLKEERKEINRNILYQNLRETNDIMNLSLLQILRENEGNIEERLYYDFTIIEQYFRKLYSIHYSNLPVQEVEEAINYASIVKEKYKHRVWANYYLTFRLGEILFYAGYKNKDPDKKLNYMEKAYHSYLQCFDGEELDETIGNILIRSEKQKIYMLNTLGNTCDSISDAYNVKLKKESDAKKKAEMVSEIKIYLGKAYKYFEQLNDIIEKRESLKREVYIRSQGVIMEHLYQNGLEPHFSEEEILTKYEEAILFAIENNDISRNSLYTWLSYYKKHEDQWNITTDKKAITYSRLASNLFPNEVVFKKFEMFAIMNLYGHSDSRTKEEIKKEMDALMEYLDYTCNASSKTQDDYMSKINEKYKILIEQAGTGTLLSS